MATFTTQISTGDDDTNYFGSSWSSVFANISVGNGGDPTDDASFRFPTVTIPQGVTITAALLTFIASVDRTGTTVSTNLYCEDTDSATQIASGTDFASRALTAAVAWNSIPAWTAESSFDSADFTPAVQAVINRAGWASGNALQVLWKNNASSASAQRSAYAYNGSSAKAARLTISYIVSTQYGSPAAFALATPSIGVQHKIIGY